LEFQCRVIVQRRCTSCCSSVENIPPQAERHSARRQELFAFPPESAFTFRPECCSESQRNRVRIQTGIAFTFDRIPHELDSLRELAEQFVEEGLFGKIPERLQNYLDCDAMARDLGMDYSETTIDGKRLIYRCA